MKDKLIEILCQYDVEIIDALNINYISDIITIVTAETRERLIDVMNILLKYNEEEYENDEFLNNTIVILNVKKNQIEFRNIKKYIV